MSYLELRQIENLARIGAHFDTGGDGEPTLSGRWGPASWWRIGLVALAVLIAVLLIMRIAG